jgi:DNA-binding MarR family transcriptional regulator
VPSQSSNQTITAFLYTILALVRRDGADLNARQLSIFLIGYLEDGPHTGGSLAKQLGIGRPAITRALDRLSEFDLVRRHKDPADHRRVHVERTIKGSAFLRDLRAIMSESYMAPLQGSSSGPS